MFFRSSRSKSAPKAAKSTFESYARRAVPYHSSAITVLAVIVFFFSIASWLVILVQQVCIMKLERSLLIQQIQISRLYNLVTPKIEVKAPEVPSPTAAAPTTTAVAPTPVAPPAVSPSGKLTRGSVSPDGTKYAGYEEQVKGKIGIAVEILANGQIKHIVIFNPSTESTGVGTPLESSLNVRWADNKTIEYDVLINKNGSQVKDTERVAIFF